MQRRVARLVDGLLIMLLAAMLLGAVTSRLVDASGRTLIVVTGGSMEPAISRGALLIIEPAPGHGVAVGDVVTMRSRSDAALVTHRVVRIVERADGRWFETRGDANAASDPVLVPSSVVVGRVTLAVPQLGRLLMVAQAPGGFLSAAGIVGLLVVLSLANQGVGGSRRLVRPGAATGASVEGGPALDPQRVRTRDSRPVPWTR